jgi:hypothetical protein
MPPKTLLWLAALVLSIAACVSIGVHFLSILWLTAAGAMDRDVLLYMTIGRGVLNGLTPYTDLFESKPPGMFLFSLLSLMLTGGHRLLSFLGAGFLLSIPLLLSWVAWEACREAKRAKIEHWAIVVASFLAGMILVLYLDNRAGGIQTEFFGTAVLCLYAIFVLRWRAQMTWMRTGVLSILLLIALGLKEPFLLPALAIALLLSGSPRAFLRVFVLPLIIAGCIGLLFLLCVGWLKPYLTYLSAMHFRTTSPDPYEPFLARGLSIRRLIYDLQHTSLPFLVYLLALVWALFPLGSSEDRRITPTIAVLVGAGATVILFHYGYLLVVALVAWSRGVQAGVSLFFRSIWYFFPALLVFMVSFWLQRIFRIFHRTLIACIALYLASLTVGIAAYAVSHFAFAVSIYFTFFLVVIGATARRSFHPVIPVILVLLTIVTALSFRPDSQHLQALHDSLSLSAEAKEPFAQKLDALLDACGIPRYAAPYGIEDFAFAGHSPVGPLFVRKFFPYLPEDHPLKVQTDANIQSAAIVLLPEGEGAEGPFLAAVQHLTVEAPPCATPYLPIAGYRAYFRPGT